MPDQSRRWLTRVREDRQAARGSIDRLCGWGAMLSPHPSWSSWFLAACREHLAEILLDPTHQAARQTCEQEGWLPRRLRHIPDLSSVPALAWLAPPESLRRQRRQSRVLENMLGDLGWCRRRRRHSKNLPIRWLDGLPLARCEHNHWHLPRVIARLGARWVSPVFHWQDSHSSQIDWSDTCPCGRNLSPLS